MHAKYIALIAAATLSAGAFAACDVSIEAADKTTGFTLDGKHLDKIEVPKSCAKFTINLKHVGKLPKQAMGHNIAIGKKSDVSNITKESQKAGIKKDYVNDKSKYIIAHSEMVGGGGSTKVEFETAKISSGGPFVGICTFPGHANMKFDLVVK